MMPIMSVREARAHFADVVDQASDQPTILTKRGREVAAVISIDALRHYEQLEEAEIHRMIDERMAGRAPGIPIEDVMAETLARDD
jgi:prevent-host-death family protein